MKYRRVLLAKLYHVEKPSCKKSITNLEMECSILYQTKNKRSKIKKIFFRYLRTLRRLELDVEAEGLIRCRYAVTFFLHLAKFAYGSQVFSSASQPFHDTRYSKSVSIGGVPSVEPVLYGRSRRSRISSTSYSMTCSGG